MTDGCGARINATPSDHFINKTKNLTSDRKSGLATLFFIHSIRNINDLDILHRIHCSWIHFNCVLAGCIYTVNVFFAVVVFFAAILNKRQPSCSQLQENYRRKNGDGLSLTFLLIWLAGDLFNLAGIIMEKLMFTMVTMATTC